MAARSISATGKSQHMPSPASTILGCGVSTVRHCSLINDDCPLLGTGPWSSREPRSFAEEWVAETPASGQNHQRRCHRANHERRRGA
jgi:hypothetical protein